MSAAAKNAEEVLQRLKVRGLVRIAGDTAPRSRPLPTGIDALDRLLGGGLPRGKAVELVGPVSSGRTAVALAAAAAATGRGEAVGLVDGPDALDPRCLAPLGGKLARLLWARPGDLKVALRATDLILDAGGFGLVILDLVGRRPDRVPSNGWARLAHAAERSGATLLLLLDRHAAGTFAAATLQLDRSELQWTSRRRGPRLLQGLTTVVSLPRSKFGPPAGPLFLKWSAP